MTAREKKQMVDDYLAKCATDINDGKHMPMMPGDVFEIIDDSVPIDVLHEIRRELEAYVDGLRKAIGILDKRIAESEGNEWK
jgi:hypothetical protein